MKPLNGSNSKLLVSFARTYDQNHPIGQTSKHTRIGELQHRWRIDQNNVVFLPEAFQQFWQTSRMNQAGGPSGCAPTDHDTQIGNVRFSGQGFAWILHDG